MAALEVLRMPSGNAFIFGLRRAGCCCTTYRMVDGQIGSWKLSRILAAGTRSIRSSSRRAFSDESAESVDSAMSSRSSGVGLMLGTTVGMLHWSRTSRRPTLTSEGGVEGPVHCGMILPRWRGSTTTWSLVARSVQLCKWSPTGTSAEPIGLSTLTQSLDAR